MDKKKLIAILKYTIGVGLGIGLFYLALRNIDLKEFWASRHEINYGWVVLALAIAILSHWFRAVRWKMLLKAAGHETNSLNLFASTMVGYLVNQAIPRGGEISRVSLTSQTERVPLSVCFGTLVTDRAFDMLILGLLVLGIGVVEYDQLIQVFDSAVAKVGAGGRNPDQPAGLPWKWIALGVLALGVLIAFLFRKQLGRMGLIEKGKNFVRELLQALLSIRKLQSPLLFIFYTLGIWFCYILMTYLVFFSIPDTSNIGPWFGLIAFTMGGIGMVIPSPGGIGSYHFAIAVTFGVYWQSLGAADYEASFQTGLKIAFIIHSAQLLMILAVGALSYLYLIPKIRANKPAAQEK